jgi:hypothetical protein
MKECPECGKTWPDDSIVIRCRNCGYQFFPVGEMSSETSDTSDGLEMAEVYTVGGKVLLCLFLLFLACLLVFALLGDDTECDETGEWCFNDREVFKVFCIVPMALLGAVVLVPLFVVWLAVRLRRETKSNLHASKRGKSISEKLRRFEPPSDT